MGRSKESIAQKREYTKEWFKRYEQENGITYAQAHPISKEKNCEYQKRYRDKFKAQYGVSLSAVMRMKRALKKAGRRMSTIEVVEMIKGMKANEQDSGDQR